MLWRNDRRRMRVARQRIGHPVPTIGTLQQLFDAADKPIARLPDTPIPPDGAKPYTDATPVIFGHYWFTGTPDTIGPTTACVDYSAVRSGPLVAYQWDGEPTLNPDNFISVQSGAT